MQPPLPSSLQCLLLAQNGHAVATQRFPLLAVKPTWRSGRSTRSNDPVPLSPIQNNSDLAQGPLPIRPAKVRRGDIYLLRQEGYMASKPKPAGSVFTVGMVLATALTILAA